MNPEINRKKLIEILSQPTEEMKQHLIRLKGSAKNLDSPDFIWNALLGSFSTMGNSRGYLGLIKNRDNFDRLSFSAVSPLTVEERIPYIEEVLRDAKVRMPRRKARWLSENCEIIKNLGGTEAAKQKALNCVGKEAKIAFLRGFKGIGDKYARNIWMDVYHSDFHDSIAIDARINGISKAIGYLFANYSDHELFYIEIAQESGLQGWELDRLLYNYDDLILSEIKNNRE